MEKQWQRMPSGNIQSRWFTLENKQGRKGQAGQANYGRKGAACTHLPAGEALTLVDTEGPGTIRRIWLTIERRRPEHLRGMLVRMTWDNSDVPGVLAPLGDFFCQPHGRFCAFENACFSSPEARSFNCVVPMPFRKAARVELINESPHDNTVFYEVDATLGDVHDENTLYFHSFWRRENPTELRRDFTILPRVAGRGRFLGAHLNVRINPLYGNFWWGEGEVKVYLDGDGELATLCGTGTEDYIGTGWGQGRYAHRYQGNHYIPGNQEADDANIAAAYGFYRFHIPDPVYFYEDCRVDIQVMGGAAYHQMLACLDDHPGLELIRNTDGTETYTRDELEADPHRGGLVERTDDVCATSYWYLDGPRGCFAEIQPVVERVRDLYQIPDAPR